MAQYIDKSALVAEIERLKDSLSPNFYEYDYDAAKVELLEKIEKFIDTLEVEEVQEEPISDDLGDYINELSKQFQEASFAKLSRIAVRVAKWQEKKDQKTIELAEDHAMLVGIEKAENLKKLADAMYYAAQTMTTDASRLWKAMDEYRQYVIQEYYDNTYGK